MYTQHSVSGVLNIVLWDLAKYRSREVFVQKYSIVLKFAGSATETPVRFAERRDDFYFQSHDHEILRDIKTMF